MAAAPAIALVDLERDARRRVGERGQHGLGAPGVTDQDSGARSRTLGDQPGEPRVLGQATAGQHRAQRVEQHQARRGDDRRGQ